MLPPPKHDAAPAGPAAPMPPGHDADGDVDADGVFGVACNALAIASQMDGAAETADSLKKVTLEFNDDGSVDVAFDDKSFTVTAAQLGLSDDDGTDAAPAGPDGDAMPPPPPVQL